MENQITFEGNLRTYSPSGGSSIPRLLGCVFSVSGIYPRQLYLTTASLKVR